MIAPDDVRAVVGKGMPMKGNPFVKGDLFIKFEVVFPKPKELSAAQLAVRVCTRVSTRQTWMPAVAVLAGCALCCSDVRCVWVCMCACVHAADGLPGGYAVLRSVRQQVKAALPAPEPVVLPTEDEESEAGVLTEMDVEAMRERQRQMRADADSDEEGGGGGGQRVQCAQQ